MAASWSKVFDYCKVRLAKASQLHLLGRQMEQQKVYQPLRTQDTCLIPGELGGHRTADQLLSEPPFFPVFKST